MTSKYKIFPKDLIYILFTSISKYIFFPQIKLKEKLLKSLILRYQSHLRLISTKTLLSTKVLERFFGAISLIVSSSDQKR